MRSISVSIEDFFPGFTYHNAFSFTVAVPPHLGVFISSQFQQRFLPGELTQFNTASFYVFGERALKNALNLYVASSREPVVIRSRILHSLIKGYKIPLCFRYSCPLQSTWRYTVGYFIKTMELGLPLARKYRKLSS